MNFLFFFVLLPTARVLQTYRRVPGQADVPANVTDVRTSSGVLSQTAIRICSNILLAD